MSGNDWKELNGKNMRRTAFFITLGTKVPQHRLDYHFAFVLTIHIQTSRVEE
jgi:hypothetical protein